MAFCRNRCLNFDRQFSSRSRSGDYHVESPPHSADWPCDAAVCRRSAARLFAAETAREGSLQRGRALDVVCAGLCRDRQGLLRGARHGRHAGDGARRRQVRGASCCPTRPISRSSARSRRSTFRTAIRPSRFRSSAGSPPPTASCWSGARRSTNSTGACSRARRSWASGPAARRCCFWRRRCVRTGSIRKRT